MKSRMMKKEWSNGGETTLNVVRHLILKNFWEIYITDEDPVPGNEDIRFAVTYGVETEMGDVSIKEVEKYIISDSPPIRDLAPAPGWEWVN